MQAYYYKKANLYAIAFLISAGDYRYKAVAVVKANGKIKKLSDLKNAKSCHTGAGKTTGWTTPVSNLIEMKIISPLKDCYSSTENVGDFFSESCVPGAMGKRYDPLSMFFCILP